MTEKNLEILDTPPKVKKALKNISVQDFQNFGLHQIAYIRNVEYRGYIIYAANGKEVDSAESLDKALIKAKQEHLEPVIVH